MESLYKLTSDLEYDSIYTILLHMTVFARTRSFRIPFRWMIARWWLWGSMIRFSIRRRRS